MENLNKENFFNEIGEQYPEAFNYFSNWINGYKKEIGWDKWFGPDVKFHDVPYEFQVGVLSRFEIEMSDNKDVSSKKRYQLLALASRTQIKHVFANLQVNLTRKT